MKKKWVFLLVLMSVLGFSAHGASSVEQRVREITLEPRVKVAPQFQKILNYYEGKRDWSNLLRANLRLVLEYEKFVFDESISGGPVVDQYLELLGRNLRVARKIGDPVLIQREELRFDDALRSCFELGKLPTNDLFGFRAYKVELIQRLNRL